MRAALPCRLRHFKKTKDLTAVADADTDIASAASISTMVCAVAFISESVSLMQGLYERQPLSSICSAKSCVLVRNSCFRTLAGILVVDSLRLDDVNRPAFVRRHMKTGGHCIGFRFIASRIKDCG